MLGAVVPSGCGSSDNGSANPNQARIRTFNAYVPPGGNNGALSVSSNGASLSGSSGVGFGQTAPASGHNGSRAAASRRPGRARA